MGFRNEADAESKEMIARKELLKERLSNKKTLMKEKMSKNKEWFIPS